MRYENVCVDAIDYVVPEAIVTSRWIEEQLASVYQALGLEPGFIEAKTGIKERRWWDEDFLPSDASAAVARKLLETRSIDSAEIQAIICASVSKDYIEPATASITHCKLGLPKDALSFDVTNACVGFLNGITIIANMIELEQIHTGLVVAGENFTPITMSTINRLLSQPPSLRSFQENFAPLTSGCGAVAMLLRHRSKSSNGGRLIGGYGYSETHHHSLCVAQTDYMTTQMTKLMVAGVETLATTAEGFKKELGWDLSMIDRLFGHQASEKYRLSALKKIGAPPNLDYPVLYNLGNIGPVSAPISLAIALEEGAVKKGHRICLSSVGSGVSSLILGIEI